MTRLTELSVKHHNQYSSIISALTKIKRLLMPDHFKKKYYSSKETGSFVKIIFTVLLANKKMKQHNTAANPGPCHKSGCIHMCVRNTILSQYYQVFCPLG